MISVVTPSFNQSGWLRLAVASVADQEGVEHEHLVQDSESADGTRDWLESDVRVSAYFERDQGMYDAINRGLRRSKGEICAYLNCDEQYLPDTLRKAEHFFRRRPEIDVLFGDFILVDATFRILSYRRVVVPHKKHSRLSHLNTATCAMFFRRRLLDRGFYFDPKWKAIGDAEWVTRLLDANVTMATLPEPLSLFTFTGTNLGSSPASRQESMGPPQISIVRKPSRRFVVGAHRLRKILAGAYRRRNLEVAVYTREQPATRKTIRATNVGFSWPESS